MERFASSLGKTCATGTVQSALDIDEALVVDSGQAVHQAYLEQHLDFAPIYAEHNSDAWNSLLRALAGRNDTVSGVGVLQALPLRAT